MLSYRDYPELSGEFIARHPQDDPRFEIWLEAWYGGPLADGWWDRDPADDILDSDREAFALFTARSWSTGRALVERFPSEQIGQTVWALLNQLQWPTGPARGERLMWDAVATLFFEVFEPFTVDALGNLSEPNGELGGALYMFWDIAGWRPNECTDVGRTAFLKLIARSLASPNAAVQESALHGIGEYTPWNDEGMGDVPEAAHLARQFAKDGTTSRPELRDYARRAATGMVL